MPKNLTTNLYDQLDYEYLASRIAPILAQMGLSPVHQWVHSENVELQAENEQLKKRIEYLEKVIVETHDIIDDLGYFDLLPKGSISERLSQMISEGYLKDRASAKVEQ